MRLELETLLAAWFVGMVSLSTLTSYAQGGPIKSDHADCSQNSQFYYFVGNGEGNDKAIATTGALLDARKNALVCLFDGAITHSAEVLENNNEVRFSGKTSISVSSEHIDWSGFELIQSVDDTQGGQWRVTSTFRWAQKEIAAIKKRLDQLEREREKNRALQADIDATRELANQKAALVQKQKKEIDDLKKSEREINQLASEKERILARLKIIKSQKIAKEAEWISLVTQLGCGVSISDIEKLVGKPERVDIDFDYLTGQGSYVSAAFFIYGNFALVAPLQGGARYSEERVQFERLSAVMSQRDRNQLLSNGKHVELVYVTRYPDRTQGWWICEKKT